MSEMKELRQRVEAEKKELEAQLARLRAQGTATTNNAVESIEHELQELQSNLRDGWERLSEGSARKLNNWLDRHKAN